MKIDNILNRNFVTPPIKYGYLISPTFKRNRDEVYLCIILDLFSRKIVDWECSNRINNELVMYAFLKAYWQRKPQKD